MVLKDLPPPLHAILIGVVEAIVSPEGENVHVGVSLRYVVEGMETPAGIKMTWLPSMSMISSSSLSLPLAVEDVVNFVLHGRRPRALWAFNGSVVDLDNVVAAGDDMVENHS